MSRARPSLDPDAARRVVEIALAEDLGGAGDITTHAVVDAGATAAARLIAKADGIVCGLDVARLAFSLVDASVAFEPRCEDGDAIVAGRTIAGVEGPARAILAAERTALNILQHLSGVATLTARAVRAAAGSRAEIYDTRKTLPGLRALAKYAVAVGGGVNHRPGLYGGILLKDNHIKVAGGIAAAVERVREAYGDEIPVEVEAETLAQVREALEAGAGTVMLDNMSIETMASAVALVGGRAVLEASGGITPADVEEVAATGVDRISMGALTDAVRLDISLEIDI